MSATDPGKRNSTVLTEGMASRATQDSFLSRLLFAMPLVCLSCLALQAEPIVVKLVNGKNGKPLSGYRVYVILGDEKEGKELTGITNKQGEISVETTTVQTIQVRPVGVISCGERPVGSPQRNYLVSFIVNPGVVTPNDCGNFKPEPHRGSIIYIAKPASAWDMFRL